MDLMKSYVPGKGIPVGVFSLEDIEEGKDKREVMEMEARTGLGYTNTKVIKKNGVPVALKVWVCTLDDMKI